MDQGQASQGDAMGAGSGIEAQLISEQKRKLEQSLLQNVQFNLANMKPAAFNVVSHQEPPNLSGISLDDYHTERRLSGSSSGQQSGHSQLMGQMSMPSFLQRQRSDQGQGYAQHQGGYRGSITSQRSMHAQYGSHEASDMQYHHNFYQQPYGNMRGRAAAYQGAEYGGGMYNRGYVPGGGRYEMDAQFGGRGRGMGRGRGRQNNRKVQIQDSLSSNKDRTVYVSEIDHNVTEEDLAILFSKCGDVVDCRLCGDAHSRMRFAFVEFSAETGEVAVAKALKFNNYPLRSYPIRVLKSRTAIVPVKRDLMPQSDEDIERCQRTIYVSNIDKRLGEQDVINFFETMCQGEGDLGKINKIRLLVDDNHSTAIAFVEFVTPESASVALANCQGALMGCLPLRVSPSKTPVRTAEEDAKLKQQAEQMQNANEGLE